MSNFVVRGDKAKIGKFNQKILCSTDECQMIELNETAGMQSKPRSRDFDILGYVVSGKLSITIGNQEYELASGDSFFIPKNTQYFHNVIENCRTVEILN